MLIPKDSPYYSELEKFCFFVILVIIFCCFFSGCANPANPGSGTINIQKLSAQGQFNPFINASSGGYLIEKSGDTSGFTITYKDETAAILVNGSKIDPLDPRISTKKPTSQE